MTRAISLEALAMLKGYETGASPSGRLLAHGAPALKTYKDIAGVATIGWGHTGPDVRMGQAITRDEAEALLAADKGKAEAAVLAMTGGKVTQGQFDALVLFSYNAGIDGLRRSTLMKLHNAGKYDLAAKQFGLWNKATVKGRKVAVAGLTTRRAAEAAIYLSHAVTAPDEPARPAQVPVTVQNATNVAAEAPKPLSRSSTIGSAVAMGGTALAGGGEGVQKLIDALNAQKAQAAELAGQVHFLAWTATAMAIIVFLLSSYLVWHRFAERREGVK